MRSLKIGFVIMIGDTGVARTTARWSEIRDLALRAEQMNFDTVWTIDELLWRVADKPQRGFWEGIAMAGAICAVTSRVQVGTWVMSALHRNPGITAKAVETLDEIQRGPVRVRPRSRSQVARAGAGFRASRGPHLRTLRRRARDHRPAAARRARGFRRGVARSPRPGPATSWAAAGSHPDHDRRAWAEGAPPCGSDIWSCYAEQRSDIEELGPRLAAFEAACAEVGRELSTIGRSAGVEVAPLARSGAADAPAGAITGGPEEIADAFRVFRAAGFTQLEAMRVPQTTAALEAMAPILGLLDAD